MYLLYLFCVDGIDRETQCSGSCGLVVSRSDKSPVLSHRVISDPFVHHIRFHRTVRLVGLGIQSLSQTLSSLSRNPILTTNHPAHPKSHCGTSAVCLFRLQQVSAFCALIFNLTLFAL